MSDQLLKIAVPNKGSLSEAAAQMLREAGYRQRTETKELVLVDDDNQVEFYYLRPRDIAIYVGEGTLDLGITGRDMLLDSGAQADALGSVSQRPRTSPGRSPTWRASDWPRATPDCSAPTSTSRGSRLG